MKTFFVSLFSSHEVSMELFSPDADMRDMASKIKGLVDTLPQQDQDSIRRGMVGASSARGWVVGSPNPSLHCLDPFLIQGGEPQCRWGLGGEGRDGGQAQSFHLRSPAS